MTTDKSRTSQAQPAPRPGRTMRSDWGEEFGGSPIEAKDLIVKTPPKALARYPNWAPKVLCELDAIYVVTPNRFRNDFYWPDRSESDNREAIAILRRLLVDRRMQSVWEALRKRSEKLEVEDWARKFVEWCLEGIARYNEAPKITPAETKRQLKAMLRWLCSLTDALQDCPSVFIRNLRVIDLMNNSDNEQPSRLSVLEFVRRLAGAVKTEVRERNTLLEIPQPNSRDAAKRFFIGILSHRFECAHKTPLHELVATITEVVFNLPSNSVQPDTVRLLVGRNRRKDARPSKK